LMARKLATLPPESEPEYQMFVIGGAP
jgi:hypothetical protein